jgi:hypothetical protein
MTGTNTKLGLIFNELVVFLHPAIASLVTSRGFVTLAVLPCRFVAPQSLDSDSVLSLFVLRFREAGFHRWLSSRALDPLKSHRFKERKNDAAPRYSNGEVYRLPSSVLQNALFGCRWILPPRL